MESISWFVASTQWFSLTTSSKWLDWDERNETYYVGETHAPAHIFLTKYTHIFLL